MRGQAATADGERHSLLLQNAETVRLVGPAGPPQAHAAAQAPSSSEPAQAGAPAGSAAAARAGGAGPGHAARAQPQDVRHAERSGRSAQGDAAHPAHGAVQDRTDRPGNAAGSTFGGSPEAQAGAKGNADCYSERESPGWQAVAVSELREGDEIYLLRQAGARHTGIAIQEFVLEK